jgi:RNA polymerase sigma-70 factor, ECF subfamily
MSLPEMDGNLEGFRDYLMILAQTQIPIEMRGRIDPSDLVQETFLCAIRGDFHRRESRTDAQTACWLRKILRCRLIDRLPGRDCEARVKSLNEQLDQSSRGLGNFLVADQSTPTARFRRDENAILVAKLLAHLPEAQREAVVLRHCEGWPVEKIGRHMNRPPAAVGGLLRRGMRKLRELMPRGE